MTTKDNWQLVEDTVFSILNDLYPGEYTRLTIGCMVYEYEKRWGLDDLAAYIQWAVDNQEEFSYTVLHDISEGSKDTACFEPRSFGYAETIKDY